MSTASGIEAYMEAVQRLPMLSERKERALALRYRAHGDVEALRDLVLPHLRLVVAVARGYLGYGLPHADLIQEGSIGLVKAVKRFDPDRGTRLASFALRWIRAEMQEYVLRNSRLVRIATTKPERKLFFNLRSMRKGLGPLTRAESERIAEALAVKPDQVVKMESRLYGQDVSLEDEDGEESGVAPEHTLASDEKDEPLQSIVGQETERRHQAGLQRALENLDPRSRRIIEARWLREEPETALLRDLAGEFNVSAERIRQIEADALGKMRRTLRAEAAAQ